MKSANARLHPSSMGIRMFYSFGYFNTLFPYNAKSPISSILCLPRQYLVSYVLGSWDTHQNRALLGVL